MSDEGKSVDGQGKCVGLMSVERKRNECRGRSDLFSTLDSRPSPLASTRDPPPPVTIRWQLNGFGYLGSDYAERNVKAQEFQAIYKLRELSPFFSMARHAGDIALSGSFRRAVRPAGPRGPEVYTSFDSFSCPWQTPAGLGVYVAIFAKTGHETRSAVSRPDNPNLR
jgi:hypothetical protein